MGASIIDLKEERLIRRAPQYSLPLGEEERNYILSSLEEVERCFGVTARPALPIAYLPGRALMRLLIGLRRSLRPQDAEQRAALGRLTGAIHLAATACALAAERSSADAPRWGGR